MVSKHRLYIEARVECIAHKNLIDLDTPSRQHRFAIFGNFMISLMQPSFEPEFKKITCLFICTTFDVNVFALDVLFQKFMSFLLLHNLAVF